MSLDSALKSLPRLWRRRRKRKWSIGMYAGCSPLDLIAPKNITNPVLCAEDVTDVRASFVADPFITHDGSMWSMFFEVMNAQNHRGEIGLAVSEDGIDWQYEQIVLREPFHLSYPYTIEADGQHYMIPETCQAMSVRLYEAVEFPSQWNYVRTLLDGDDYVDPSAIYFDGIWWLFTSTTASEDLRLHYAADLFGEWIEHPQSPVIQGRKDIARPAGRLIQHEGSILRFAQDDTNVYGKQVRVFEIVELTTTTYVERCVDEEPLLKPSGIGWNALRMHHIDAQQIGEASWLACVDGREK